MKNAGTISMLVIIALVLFGCNPATPEPQINQTTVPDQTTQVPNEPGETSPATTSGVTRAELSLHNSETDCWIAYDNEAYDLTAFLPKHPGGIAAIKRYCGTAEQFQDAFTQKHGASKVANLKRQPAKGSLLD